MPSKKGKNRKPNPAKRSLTRLGAAAPDPLSADVLTWENDPFAQAVLGQAPVPATPVPRPVPDLSNPSLPVAIVNAAPAAGRYSAGTPEFRYWAAAEALRRGADFWAAMVPSGTTWHATVGQRLRVRLDAGEDLNAFYDRRGLEFYHATVAGVTVYSGESGDIVAHELGHAVLDAIRPQLFDAASIEAAAFHESFGDVSAMLVGLQMPSLRQRVLVETEGRLAGTSRISRVAEQLGWAIRQRRTDSVDPDSLRNASNSFFYRDPASLPPFGPASSLSSAPHNFSRIFTGAFLEALAGIFTVLGPKTEATLLESSHIAGRILVKAILSAPIVPAYFSQVAAALVNHAEPQFRSAVSTAFVRHGVLSLEAAAAVSNQTAGRTTAAGSTPSDAEVEHTPLLEVGLSCAEYGLADTTIVVQVAGQAKRYEVAGSALSTGSVENTSDDIEAKMFLEDLFRRGRISLSQPDHPFQHGSSKKTHEVTRTGRKSVLRRIRFDCGFDCTCI